jgi:hypothetical protein
MVSIYSPLKNTKRLDYVARHIFHNIIRSDFEIVAEKEIFMQRADICINYSEEVLNHGLHIIPQGLLSEKGIRTIADLGESEWKGLFCFFKQEKGDIPFDIFAASFYLLTLYEEYFSEAMDEHGRFDPKESLAYRKHFLEIPIVDRWTFFLKEELKKTCPKASFDNREYRFISTIDIDHPYLYRNKGLIKTLGNTVKDLLKLDLKTIVTRLATVFALRPDPYMESIRAIDALHKKENRLYYLFVLMGGRGKYGRTTVYPPKTYYQYLRNLDRVVVGLHPSYETYRNLQTLITEKKRLEKVLQQGNVTATRQHFLRMRSPETFQELTIAEFTDDFTLAYAKAPGFRSGTAIPHYFYDIEKEESTGLLLHPTIMMDSTLIFHWRMKPEEALDKIKRLIDECKKSGGDYLSLWHNSNLAGKPANNPWINVFIESFRYAISLENVNFDPKNNNHS